MNQRSLSQRVSAYVLSALLLLSAIAMPLALVGCSGEEEVEYQTVGDSAFTIEVPTTWTVEESEADEEDVYNTYECTYTSDDFSAIVILQTSELPDLGADLGAAEEDDLYAALEESFEENGCETGEVTETTTTDGVVERCYDCSWEIDDSALTGYIETVISGEDFACIWVFCHEDQFENYSTDLDAVLDSLTIADPAEPDFSNVVVAEETQTIGNEDFTIEVPVSWDVEAEEADGYTQYTAESTSEVDYEALAILQTMTLEYIGATTTDEIIDTYDYMLELYGIETNDVHESTSDEGVVTCTYECEWPMTDDYTLYGYIEIVISGDDSASIWVFCPEEQNEEYGYLLDTILDSLVIVDPSEPDFSAVSVNTEEVDTTETEPTTDSDTTENESTTDSESTNDSDTESTTDSDSTASGDIASFLAEFGTFEETTVSGSGNDVVELPVTGVPMLMTITYESDDGEESSFKVDLYDADGEYLEWLVREYGCTSYSGVVTNYMSFTWGYEGAMLQVEAEGSWTITFSPMSSMSELVSGSEYSGYGVYYLNTDSLSTLTVTSSSDSGSFYVYGCYDDEDYGYACDTIAYDYSDEGYSGTVIFTNTPCFVIVYSSGTYTISW